MRYSVVVGLASHWNERNDNGWKRRACVPERLLWLLLIMNDTCPREAVNRCAMNDLSSYFTHRSTIPLSSIYIIPCGVFAKYMRKVTGFSLF